MTEEQSDHLDKLSSRLKLIVDLGVWLLGGAFAVGGWVATLEWRARTGDEHLSQVKTEASIEKLRNDMQEQRLYDQQTKAAVMQNDLTYIRSGIEEMKAANRTKTQ